MMILFSQLKLTVMHIVTVNLRVSNHPFDNSHGLSMQVKRVQKWQSASRLASL